MTYSTKNTTLILDILVGDFEQPSSYYKMLDKFKYSNPTTDSEVFELIVEHCDIFSEFFSDLFRLTKVVEKIEKNGLSYIYKVFDANSIKEFSTKLQDYSKDFRIYYFSVFFIANMYISHPDIDFEITTEKQISKSFEVIYLDVIISFLNIALKRKECAIPLNIYSQIIKERTNKILLFTSNIKLLEDGKYLILSLKDENIIQNCEEYIISSGKTENEAISNIKNKEEKIFRLKEAFNDLDYLKDIENCGKDFESIDFEETDFE